MGQKEEEEEGRAQFFYKPYTEKKERKLDLFGLLGDLLCLGGTDKNKKEAGK